MQTYLSDSTPQVDIPELAHVSALIGRDADRKALAVMTREPAVSFDYDRQAWVVDGVYQRCGHPGSAAPPRRSRHPHDDRGAVHPADGDSPLFNLSSVLDRANSERWPPMEWKPTLYMPLRVQDAPRAQALLFASPVPRTEPPCEHPSSQLQTTMAGCTDSVCTVCGARLEHLEACAGGCGQDLPSRHGDRPTCEACAQRRRLPLLRRFSPAGPCLTLGRLVRETAKFYVYLAGRNGTSGPAAEMIEHRIIKDSREPYRYSGAHVEPCLSCTDHPQTQYPNGYMD